MSAYPQPFPAAESAPSPFEYSSNLFPPFIAGSFFPDPFPPQGRPWPRFPSTLLYHHPGFRSDRAFPPSLVSLIMGRGKGSDKHVLRTVHETPLNDRFTAARFGQMRRAFVGGLKCSRADLPPVYRTLDPGQGLRHVLGVVGRWALILGTVQ